MALSYLTGSVTQGSNDAFAEGEIATALAGAGNFALRIRELLFEVPNNSQASGANVQVVLSRRSKSAMPLITDRDVIAKFDRLYGITTSGAVIYEKVIRFTFTEDDEVLIVEDPLYLDFDTASTSASSTAYVRIGYERVSISAVDRLTLLTQSLE